MQIRPPSLGEWDRLMGGGYLSLYFFTMERCQSPGSRDS